MIQEKLIGLIRGTVTNTDVWKLMLTIIQFLTLFVLIFILIFAGMFGHIISDELHSQRLQVLNAIEMQSKSFASAIASLHPHYLIESPIRQFSINKEGNLIVNGKRITSQEELDEIVFDENRSIKSLNESYNYDK